MNNINYSDFKNICRTCTLNCDVKFIQDAVISDIFYRLTDIPFETNDDLPKQICRKCFEKINEIQEFSKKCKQAHSTLMECLNNHKNIEIKVEQEITIEQHPIEFVKTEEINVDEDDLQKHLYKCDECSKSFTRPTNLKIHKREHSGERPYKCNQCEESFTKSIYLKRHKYKHYSELPYKCDQCSESFKQDFNLQIHKRTHNVKGLYKCEECSKSYSEIKAFNSHIQEYHREPRPHKCDQCFKTFVEPNKLRIHKRVHSGERPYKCDLCGKGFINASNLRNHARVHTGECPFKCDECLKSFKNPGNLKRHKLMHSGEKPFKCVECAKSYSQVNALKYHIHVVHTERL